MLMTQAEFENEKRYMILMHHVRRMMETRLITEEEFHEIDTKYRQKYRPKSGALLVEKDLLCERKRVMNGIGKEASENEKDQHS